eukprot:scaffold4849_cov131-Isochrysis_galbana.AAC.2
MAAVNKRRPPQRQPDPRLALCEPSRVRRTGRGELRPRAGCGLACLSACSMRVAPPKGRGPPRRPRGGG